MNKKTKICLNAMVGNEAPTITRMLQSVAPYVDYYVIQCNGTQDNTREIIDSFFKEKGIPGFTYFVEWDFPGWNRNHTLQEALKADHGCDWIFRMDADETLEVDDDFDWSILDDTTVFSWNVNAVNGGTRYMRTWMWNAKLPWFFQLDKRHETIHLPHVGENFQRLNLPKSFRHRVSQDGESWYVPRKFLRDALELEIDNVVGDKVKHDLYHLWYIGKSYTDCYGRPDELAFGKQHSDEYARRGIWYFERYLELVHGWTFENPVVNSQNEMAYFALILMAQAYEFMGNTDLSFEYFDLAEKFCYERNEHLYFKLTVLENHGMFKEALDTVRFMKSPERKNPYPNLCFLIDERIYHDTGNLLNILEEEYNIKLSSPVINLESFNFSFS
jgi:hypothetical protein